jgi:hypothetical protein
MGLSASLLIVVAVVIGIGPTTTPLDSSGGQDELYDREVSTLLAGIPQAGRALGSSAAPVTLQVFADLEDNDSQRWVLTLLPAIIDEFVRRGALRIEYLSYKTNTVSPETFVKQQTAAVAAGAQNMLWNFVYTFYYEQGKEYTPYVTEGYLDRIAGQIPGLNIALWHKDRNDGRRSEQVVANDQEARAYGIHVTPAYRLGRTGGRLKDFDGSEAITFPKQRHPTTFASAEDIANALNQIH